MFSVHTSPLASLGQTKTGGMNVYVREFTRELARRGVAVDVFTRAAAETDPYIQYDLGCGCRVINITAGPRQPVPNDALAPYLDEFAQGVARFARDYGLQYDLLHSHYWLSGVVAGKMRQFWGALPVVHMYHTLGHLKNQIAQEASQLVAPVRLIGENHVAHLADCLIAATSSEKAQLIDLYGVDPAKIAIVPPGVDLGRFAPTKRCVAKRRLGLPKTERLILFVGRIEPLKGIDTLLEAVSLLQAQHPAALENVRVGIIGGNPHAPDAELSRLLAVHAQLNLGETVEFLGARDQSQLPDYYAAASVVVMPSHYESFGMVALEAMAMGTPVIASRVGGLAHLVRDGETGFLMPPRQPQALADRLHRLLTDDALLKELSTQAQQYAQTYHWANVVDRMMDVYDSVSEPVPVVVR